MQVITVGGRSYLAGVVTEEDNNTVVIGDALEIGGNVTPGVIEAYLCKENLGELSRMTLAGAQSYSTRDLTKEEGIALDHAKAQFELAKSLAIPRLENTTFSNVRAGH